MAREQHLPGEGRGRAETGERRDPADLTGQLSRRIGFEVELLAPPGSSRRTLADALAASCRGTVQPVWHQASEPAPVESLGGRFLHLTQGFEIRRFDGEPMCTLVDDVTITADLNSHAAAPDGWLRILTDDLRLLQLLANCSDPGDALDHILEGVAKLWNATPERVGNVWRLDVYGATVALAMPAGAERERPCEIVTPPLTSDHHARLDELMQPAAALGFTVPQEAAVHLHVDGGPFRNAPAVANLIRLFGHWRVALREELGTNPNCRRLAPLPAALVAAVDGSPTIDDLREIARESGLTKFYDLNLTQVLSMTPLRDTVEVRILPGTIDAADVVRRAALVERLLDRCLDPEPIPPPDSADAGLASLLSS